MNKNFVILLLFSFNVLLSGQKNSCPKSNTESEEKEVNSFPASSARDTREEKKDEILNRISENPYSKTNILKQLRNREQSHSQRDIAFHKNQFLYKIVCQRNETIPISDNGLCFSNEGKYIAVKFFYDDENIFCIKIYDSLTGSCIKKIEDIPATDGYNTFLEFTFSDESNWLLVFTSNSVTLYNLKYDYSKKIFERHNIEFAGFIAEDKIFCISKNDEIEICDFRYENYKVIKCDVGHISRGTTENYYKIYRYSNIYYMLDDDVLILLTDHKFLKKIDLKTGHIDKIEYEGIYKTSHLKRGYLILFTDNGMVQVIDIEQFKIVEKKQYDKRFWDGIFNIVKFPIISSSCGSCTYFYDLKNSKELGHPTPHLSNYIVKTKQIGSNTVAAFLDCGYPRWPATIYVWMLNDLSNYNFNYRNG